MKRSIGARTIAYPLPVWVFGSYDNRGRANMATVAWAGICASEPPTVNVSFKKERYTRKNILEKKRLP